MIAGLIKLWAGAKFYALAIAGAAAALFFAYWRVRQDGKAAAEIEQQKARDALQEHYDEIDRQPIDAAGSYDRLRGLSDDKGRR